MKLPTIEEINPILDNLDGQSAVKKFHGKTLEEAEKMFCDALECHTEDLMWMGPKAFCFYVEAIISYVKGESSQGDDSVFFLSTPISYKVSFERNEIAPVFDDVKNLVKYVFENWSKFTNEYEDGENNRRDWEKIAANIAT